MSKPSYYGAMDNLRRQIMDAKDTSQQSPNTSSNSPVKTSPANNAPTGNSDSPSNSSTDPQLRSLIPLPSAGADNISNSPNNKVANCEDSSRDL